MNVWPTQQKDLGEFWACQGRTPEKVTLQLRPGGEKKL